jgi:hypothetical protein
VKDNKDGFQLQKLTLPKGFVLVGGLNSINLKVNLIHHFSVQIVNKMIVMLFDNHIQNLLKWRDKH